MHHALMYDNDNDNDNDNVLMITHPFLNLKIEMNIHSRGWKSCYVGGYWKSNSTEILLSTFKISIGECLQS